MEAPNNHITAGPSLRRRRELADSLPPGPASCPNPLRLQAPVCTVRRAGEGLLFLWPSSPPDRWAQSILKHRPPCPRSELVHDAHGCLPFCSGLTCGHCPYLHAPLAREPERAGGPFTKTRLTTKPVSWSRQKRGEGPEEPGTAMPRNKQWDARPRARVWDLQQPLGCV